MFYLGMSRKKMRVVVEGEYNAVKNWAKRLKWKDTMAAWLN